MRGFTESMRAKKYVQSHTVSEDAGKGIREPSAGMKVTYDGITEVWWVTLEDFGGGGVVEARAEAARALKEDIPNLSTSSTHRSPDRRARTSTTPSSPS